MSENFVRIHGLRDLYDLFSMKLYKFEKNRKSVAHRHVVGGIAQSPHGHRAEPEAAKTAEWCHGHSNISAQPLHRSRMGSVSLPSGGCGNCTATPLRLDDFHTISAQPLSRGPIQEIARWRCSEKM